MVVYCLLPFRCWRSHPNDGVRPARSCTGPNPAIVVHVALTAAAVVVAAAAAAAAAAAVAAGCTIKSLKGDQLPLHVFISVADLERRTESLEALLANLQPVSSKKSV